MRLTVGTKITIGLTVILCIGSISLVIIYSGLRALEQALHDLTEIEHPISAVRKVAGGGCYVPPP